MKKFAPITYELSAADKTLFRQTIKQIPSTRHSKQIVPEFDLYDHWPETVAADEMLFFSRPSVSKPIVRQMKQGKLTQSDILDLHGKTVQQAKKAIKQFLSQAYCHHYRCVRIIHGKSKYLEPTPPVLKNYINGWLQQHPCVLAFCSALIKDGGNGAVYVLLQTN
jgi:DNA-nicking Smr family endonuclease